MKTRNNVKNDESESSEDSKIRTKWKQGGKWTMRKVKAVITVVIAERKFQNMESENNQEKEKTRGKGDQQEQGEYC
jgi:hypothetical protein